MDFTYNGTINLATAGGSDRKKWANRKWLWSDFVEKISEPTVTHETYKEYLGMSKAEQAAIKNVGGYVGAYLKDGLRRNANVVSKQLITLDIDFGTAYFWDDFTLMFDCAACLHSTHKHSTVTPRYRLLIPLDREVTPEEYQAISRKVAEMIDIELFDPTTFEIARLMYWGSHAKDGEWVFEYQDGEWLSADKILSMYTDWRDISEWAFAQGKASRVTVAGAVQRDPTEKKGLIGAFCRVYDVYDVIEKFLSDVYEPTLIPSRFTYIGGTTAGGLVVYEDGKFAFSHHSTDPASGSLMNAFDLVRVHRFGALDDGYSGPAGKAPSFLAMFELVKDDEPVSQQIVEEKLDEAVEAFSNLDEEGGDDWKSKLTINNQKVIESTTYNMRIILKNDEDIKGKIAFNLFDSKRYILGSLPWRKIDSPEPMKDLDIAGFRNWFETKYGIVSNGKVEDSLSLEFSVNSYHPVRDYILGLIWDGKPRVDKLLVEYFGADDNAYTREAMRKMLAGALHRVFVPGCKFDLVLVLVGPQGARKSEFFSRLGREWFSDTFTTMAGKESFEQLQGSWILEMAELAALRKMEIETIKHFITKRTDRFRPAYGRVVEDFPRQCVFVATTNSRRFLRDATGNRRWMPVDIHPERVAKDPFIHMPPDEVNQIWAEAYQLYVSGETLYLSREAEQIANDIRDDHTEVDDRSGMVESYLSVPLPENWDSMDIDLRRMYLANEDEIKRLGTVVRTKVSNIEIWSECMGQPSSNLTPQYSRAITDLMGRIDGWVSESGNVDVPMYGRQRIYRRKN